MKLSDFLAKTFTAEDLMQNVFDAECDTDDTAESEAITSQEE